MAYVRFLVYTCLLFDIIFNELLAFFPLLCSSFLKIPCIRCYHAWILLVRFHLILISFYAVIQRITLHVTISSEHVQLDNLLLDSSNITILWISCCKLSANSVPYTLSSPWRQITCSCRHIVLLINVGCNSFLKTSIHEIYYNLSYLLCEYFRTAKRCWMPKFLVAFCIYWHLCIILYLDLEFRMKGN